MPFGLGKSVKCGKCGAKFSDDSELKQHMEVHYKPLPCPECGKMLPYFGDEKVDCHCPSCGRLIQAGKPPVQLYKAPREPTRYAVIAVIIVIFLIVFLCAPMVPYTFASHEAYCYGTYYCSPSYSVTGGVSISYSLFKCGVYVINGGSVTAFGYQSSYSGSSGWKCG